ncbi:MAG: hypothetical protein ABSA40_06465 [Candidatus Dormibacteria bacterium]
MDDLETLVRYLIPGTIAMSPLGLWLGPLVVNGKGVISAGLAALLVGLAIPAGYLLHQVWLAIFKRRSVWEPQARRSNLTLLAERGNAPREGKDQHGVYLAWESWIYSDNVPSRQFDQAKRLWRFYHGTRASVLAALLAIVMAPAAGVLNLSWWAPVVWFCVGLLGILLLLMWRAHQLWCELDDWELMIAVDNCAARELTLADHATRFMRAWPTAKAEVRSRRRAR